MSKASNCIITIAPGNLQNENVVRQRIEKIFKSEPILHDVSIILDAKSMPLDIGMLVGNIQNFELDEFKKLPELLREVSAYSLDGFITIEAIPMHQISDNADLDIIDSIHFSSITRQIRLKLNKSTFQSTPNVFGSQKGILVKKVKESKKGHGASNYVSYNYLITFSILEENISNEINHLIKSVFGNSTVKVQTNNANNISSLQGENKTVGSLAKIPLKLNVRNYPIFDDTGFREQSQAIYEYLTLFHINSPQLTENIDDYISSYQAPNFMSEYTEEVRPGKELFRHTFEDIDLAIFTSLMKSGCLSISAYTMNTHILISNNPNNLVLWECQ